HRMALHLRYSITSSARPSRSVGIVRPSDLAVLRLITSSIFVDLLHRQIGRAFTLENTADVDTGLPPRGPRTMHVCLSRHLFSELVCDAELEKVLHHRQLIRNDQRATRGRRTTGTDSRVRSAEGIEVAREIPEIGETILGTSYPTGPE